MNYIAEICSETRCDAMWTIMNVVEEELSRLIDGGQAAQRLSALGRLIGLRHLALCMLRLGLVWMRRRGY